MGAMTSLTSLRLTASRRMTSPPYEIVAQGTDVLLTYLRKSFVYAAPILPLQTVLTMHVVRGDYFVWAMEMNRIEPGRSPAGVCEPRDT